MPTWDRRTPEQQAKVRDAAIRRQLRDRVGPFSPFWRERFSALRITPASITGAADLTKLPAVSERDVCPSGDPREAARLVLQADEAGFALHAHGPELRKALARRATGRHSYRRQVEAEVRPTTYHLAGRALHYPIASTRTDLDLIARAGARAWSVLGLTAGDVLVSAVPVAATLDHTFLTYAALGAGAPALFAGPDGFADAVRVVPPTVVAVRPADVAVLAGAFAAAGPAAAGPAAADRSHLSGLRTVLLVGPWDPAARDAAAEIVAGATVADATILGLWGPDEGRVLWAQCRESAGSPTGWHTYPDLDYVELVDPETGAPSTDGGELTLTQLGFHGSALLRWRTDDVVDGRIEIGACPACGRTVPRVPTQVRGSSLTVDVRLRPDEAAQPLDLRSVSAVLASRKDLADWMVEVTPSSRDHDNLFVLIAPTGDETDAAVGVYRDVRAAAGVTPSQIVVLTPDELAARRETNGPRVVVRR